MADNEKLDKVKSESKTPDKKDKTEKKSNKPSLIARIKQWFKETKAELKVIEQTPAEEMDRTLAPKPGTETPAEEAEPQES